MTPNWSRRPPSLPTRPPELGGAVEVDGLYLRPSAVQGAVAIAAKRDDAQIRSALEAVAGTPAPDTPNGATFSRSTLLWPAPTRWLLLTDESESATICAELRAACAGATVLVSDATDGLAFFNIGGPLAPSLLSKLCALDFASAAMGPRRCARTRLVRIPVTLLHTQNRGAYQVIVDRSFASYAWSMLSDAAREYAPGADTR